MKAQLNLHLKITTSSLHDVVTGESGADAQELHFFNMTLSLIEVSFVQYNSTMIYLLPFYQITALLHTLPFHSHDH